MEAGKLLGTVLESAWKFARDAFIVADAVTGVVIDANPAAQRITGFSQSELVGKPQVDLYPDAEREAARQAFESAKSRPATHANFHLLCRDGHRVPVEVTSAPAFDAQGGKLVVASFRDITKLLDHERRLALKAWALEAYAGAAMALVRAGSSATLVQEICEAITRESIFVLAWVGYADDGPEKKVHIAGASGRAASYLDGFEVSWNEDRISGCGPTGVSLRTNSVQTMADAETAEMFSPWRERAKESGIRSSFTAPFSVGVGSRGVLVVYSSQPDAFGAVVTDAFTHLAEELGIGLHRLEQAEHLEQERRQRDEVQKELTAACAGIVGAITTAMEMRDPYTSGHQRGVAELAGAIAREMGWIEERIEALKVAALVHDVGKIAVPAEILTKPTRLSSPEWALMQGHVEKSYEILKDVPFRWPIAEAVYQHHERLDGSGYPRGLTGADIIPGARILAVADVVESVANSRPYRAAHGIDAALEQIQSQAGTKLDAEVVAACLSLFREKGFSLGSR